MPPLLLRDSLVYSCMRPCLARRRIAGPRRDVVSAKWFRCASARRGDDKLDHARQAHAPLISKRECRSLYGNRVSKKKLCAGKYWQQHGVCPVSVASFVLVVHPFDCLLSIDSHPNSALSVAQRSLRFEPRWWEGEPAVCL